MSEKWNLQVDDKGRIDVPDDLTLHILRKKGIRSRKERIQKKTVKNFIIGALRAYVDHLRTEK